MFKDYYYGTLALGIIFSVILMCAIPGIMRAIHGPFSKKDSYFISFGEALGIYVIFDLI